MNVFVLGPRALVDQVSRMIDESAESWGAHKPPLAPVLVTDAAEGDLVISEESAAKLSSTDDFVSLVSRAFLEQSMQALQQTIAGPFSHDVRGALSVVSLSQQLLGAGGDGKVVSDKLGRVGFKVNAAMADLDARVRCLSGAWPPEPHEAGRDATSIEQIPGWFSRAHQERQLVLSDAAFQKARAAPPWFSVVLGGAIDGIARLSRGDVSLEEAEAGPAVSVSLCVSGKDTHLDEVGARVLANPARWALLDPAALPYRLATAGMIVLASGGTVDARVAEGAVEVTFRLP